MTSKTGTKDASGKPLLDDKTFLICGLIVAIIIAVLAVFLASGSPDGLESTALYVQGEKTLTGDSPEDGDPEAIGTGTFSYSSPLPDYVWEALGGVPGGIVAIIIGILITFGLIFGVSYIIKTKD